jgi:hypothetical protein
MKPEWRDVLDVLKGGLQMHIMRAHIALILAAFGLAGAFAAGMVAFAMSDRFEAKGTMMLAVQPAVPVAARFDGIGPKLMGDLLSRDTLTGVIERHNLYASERARQPMEEVAHRMRRDITLQYNSNGVFQVSFFAPDRGKAQQVVRDLMAQISQSKEPGSRSLLQVIDPPGPAQRAVSPERITVAVIIGLGGGTLLGAIASLLRRRSLSHPT